ncbi:hypothetical protein DERP_011664 [Dermatophagoides pteronyssinus]|uniref:Uncharacterized protein n=1 Tax=Dermatophagoides pteronyssinus TaxID=6956 RepID=A0ABQ8JWJ3_DERPT|nr:hypothetical protein DERP_011664 [Dermatophagoides pteronyssinus]
MIDQSIKGDEQQQQQQQSNDQQQQQQQIIRSNNQYQQCLISQHNDIDENVNDDINYIDNNNINGRKKRSGIADQRLAELLELARMDMIRKLVRDNNQIKHHSSMIR